MTIEELLGALKPLDRLRGFSPDNDVTTFLMVALDEGKWPSAYARDADMSRISMSRCLRDIGETSRTGGPGLGLVKAVRDPSNLHRRRVLAAPEGARAPAARHALSEYHRTRSGLVISINSYL